MLPNEKFDLSALKNFFDEGGANRITPKLLRDFLVSSYGSRYSTRLVDSQDLTENEDIVTVRMTEDENYLRLPDSKGVDNSGTPFVYKRYTIFNNSPEYGFRIITKPNDRFKNENPNQVLQEISVQPNEVWELFCFDERWYAFLIGSVPEDISGSPSIVTRLQSIVGSSTNAVVDRLHADVTAVKWTIRAEDPTGEVYSSLEVLASKKKNGIDFVEHTAIGDEMDIQYSVTLSVDNEIELNIQNNLNNPVTFKVLKHLVD